MLQELTGIFDAQSSASPFKIRGTFDSGTLFEE